MRSEGEILGLQKMTDPHRISLTTSAWGRTWWPVLHGIMYQFKDPDAPLDPVFLETLQHFLQLQCLLLPCIVCRPSYTHFSLHVVPFPNTKHVTGRDLQIWMYQIHNCVNTKLEVPESRWPALETVNQRFIGHSVMWPYDLQTVLRTMFYTIPDETFPSNRAFKAYSQILQEAMLTMQVILGPPGISDSWAERVGDAFRFALQDVGGIPEWETAEEANRWCHDLVSTMQTSMDLRRTFMESMTDMNWMRSDRDSDTNDEDTSSS